MSAIKPSDQIMTAERNENAVVTLKFQNVISINNLTNPSRKNIPPSGMKNRSGLNKTVTRSTKMIKFRKSIGRIFDFPTRLPYSIGV